MSPQTEVQQNVNFRSLDAISSIITSPLPLIVRRVDAVG